MTPSSYYLCLPLTHKESLAPLRAWENLKVAFEGQHIWLTNFDQAQMESSLVKKLPFQKSYYAENGKLFPSNSLLPARQEPSLLWTPIQRAFAIKMPTYNHNYFGANQSIDVKLIASDTPQDAGALLVSLQDLGKYVETASAVRLQDLHWVLVGEQKALIFGTPLLPIPGKAFWIHGTGIFPVGFDLEFPIIRKKILDMMNPKKLDWVVWQEDGSYFLIGRSLLEPLSIASFRKTCR